MKRALLIITLGLGLGCLTPKAEAADTDVTKLDNTIYSTAREVTAGETVTLSLSMKNKMLTTGYQVDIELPEGIDFAQEGGYYEAYLSLKRLDTKKSHVFSAEMQGDGTLRLLCYSSKNIAFKGNDGEVATVDVTVADDAPLGPQTVILKAIVLTDDKGSTSKSVDVSFTLTVTSPYDLDHDGHVNSTDVGILVNYILGQASANAETSASYDINHNGEVNVGDVTQLMAYIIAHPELK